METIQLIGLSIGGGLLIFAAVLAIHGWNISKILIYSQIKQIKISHLKTDQMMRGEGFETKASFTFYGGGMFKEGKRKIKKLALECLVNIFQKPAKEILDTYFVTVTIDSRKRISPKRNFQFLIKATVWTKKKPDRKEKEDSANQISVFAPEPFNKVL